jgi:hypothetical protein
MGAGFQGQPGGEISKTHGHEMIIPSHRVDDLHLKEPDKILIRGLELEDMSVIILPNR